MYKYFFAWGYLVNSLSVTISKTCQKLFTELLVLGDCVCARLEKYSVFLIFFHTKPHANTQDSSLKLPLLYKSFPRFPQSLLLLTRVERI